MPDTGTGPVYLSDQSPKDKKWDERRSEADGFRDLYKGTDFDCYSTRINNCSQLLVFGLQSDDTGNYAHKLQAAKFCRVRHCPVCQWRRSSMWRAKAFEAFPQLLKDYPKSRFIFLTLTVRNCPLSELRETLTWMNKSWKRLIERKDWPAQGWIRSVEVTRDKDDWAHPHFHCLLMVPPSYFKGGAYLSHERWRALWKDCLKVDYDPSVNIKTVKPSKGAEEATEEAARLNAVCETLKYSIKANDILENGSQNKDAQAWLVGVTQQLHKTRAVATGGLLKEYMKLVGNEPDDLIHADEDGISEADTNSPRVAFGWHEGPKRYQLEKSC